MKTQIYTHTQREYMHTDELPFSSRYLYLSSCQLEEENMNRVFSPSPVLPSFVICYLLQCGEERTTEDILSDSSSRLFQDSFGLFLCICGVWISGGKIIITSCTPNDSPDQNKEAFTSMIASSGVRTFEEISFLVLKNAPQPQTFSFV